MEARDTVTFECICRGRNFNNPTMSHQEECLAYNRGKERQAEIAFKAGIKEVINYLDCWKDEYGNCLTAVSWEAYQSKLKEWE